MKLGTRGRYAVMAMVELAQAFQKGPVSLSEIAEKQEISLSYLEQLFSKLKNVGLVQSVRGASGGYILSRPPRLIYIADIVAAADKPFKATRCAHKGGGCLRAQARCAVHHLWEALGNKINGFLQSVSLQDILDKNIIPVANPHTSLSVAPKDIAS